MEESKEITQMTFDTGYTPASITADFAAARKWLENKLFPYRDLTDEVLSTMSLGDIKKSRSDVNGAIKRIEDERKRIKRGYMAPLNEFEASVKELLEPAREAEAMLANAVKRKDELDKEERLLALLDFYSDIAGPIIDVVAFDSLLNPSWLNKTGWKETEGGLSNPKAERELAEKVAQVRKDWDTLSAQARTMPFFQEAEAEFLRTLDLGAALRLNDMRVEEQARIEAARAEREADRAWREGAVETLPADDVREEASEVPQAPEAPQETPQAPVTVQAPVAVYMVRIEATVEQRDAVVAFFKANGIHGRIWREKQ